MLYSQPAAQGVTQKQANMDENPQFHANVTVITHPGTQKQLLVLQPQQMLWLYLVL